MENSGLVIEIQEARPLGSELDGQTHRIRAFGEPEEARSRRGHGHHPVPAHRVRQIPAGLEISVRVCHPGGFEIGQGAEIRPHLEYRGQGRFIIPSTTANASEIRLIELFGLQEAEQSKNSAESGVAADKNSPTDAQTRIQPRPEWTRPPPAVPLPPQARAAHWGR